MRIDSLRDIDHNLIIGEESNKISNFFIRFFQGEMLERCFGNM